MRDNRKLLYIVCTLGLLTLCCNNNNIINLQLKQAACYGQVDVVKSLIDAGADVNYRDEYGSEPYFLDPTVLSCAARKGHIEVVKLLINAGVDVDNKNRALYDATVEGHIEIVKALINAGADDNDGSALRFAALKGHIEIVKALINAGTDVNKSGALPAAATNGHIEVVKLLINAGVDVDNKNRALAVAAMRGNIEIFKALINAGANADNKYLTLVDAARGGHIEIVKALINAGADDNDNNKKQALIIAAGDGHLEIVKALINAGADVNGISKVNGISDDSPLCAAVAGKHVDIVKALIEAGADVNAGIIPPLFHVFMKRMNQEKDFQEKDYIEIVKSLIMAGANVNAKTVGNLTALHYATKDGTPPYEVAKLLVSAGADVNAEDNLHVTPLDYVSEPYKSQIRQAKANPLHIPDKPQVQPSQAAILDAQANSSAPSPSLEDEDDEEEIIDESDEQEDSTSTAQKYGVKYIREITYKGKSTPSWIILQDTKGRPCAIVTSSKYPILESKHYCIPFSGNDKDLKDSFAGNSVAEIDFPDHKKCKKVKTISDNDYCNEFYKAFGDMAKREQFFSVAEICKNDPYVDSEFQDHICEYLNLEDDLD